MKNKFIIFFIIIIIIISSFSQANASNWVERTSAGNLGWTNIASSSDGSKLVAVKSGGGFIYKSDDSGNTWTEITPPVSASWNNIASSSDGSILVISEVTGSTPLYISTDRGLNWTTGITPSNLSSWTSIASSSDGTKLAATSSINYIYTSDDSGATWTERTSAGSKQWTSIASSSDGTKLAAAMFGETVCGMMGCQPPNPSYIYTSDDSGSTWTERTSITSEPWASIASSSDGSKLVVVSSDGHIHTSDDSGSTWTERTSAGNRQWKKVTSSSDGSKLVAIAASGYIYMSDDSGATWTETILGNFIFKGLASSSDGTKLALVHGNSNGYIYTYDSNNPLISNVSALNIDNTNSTINWTTDKNSSSIVEYGTTNSYGNLTTETDTLTGTVSHTVNLSDLNACTTYHYRVKSNDVHGNLNTSSDYNFTTPGCGVVLPSILQALSNDLRSQNSDINNNNIIVETTIISQEDSLNIKNNCLNGDIFNRETGQVCNTVFNSDTQLFLRPMDYGSNNFDVLRLQKFLNNNGHILTQKGPGSLNNETSYYGQLTKSAVGSFQIRHNVVLDEFSIGYGVFGPKTMSTVNALLVQ